MSNIFQILKKQNGKLTNKIFIKLKKFHFVQMVIKNNKNYFHLKTIYKRQLILIIL